MHDGAQPTPGDEGLDQADDRFAVGQVACDDLHRRTGLTQFRRQLRRTRSVPAPPRHQHQIPHPTLSHQIPRHHRTQTTRTPRHQHRTLTIQRRHGQRQFRLGETTEPRHQHHTVTDGDLGLAREGSRDRTVHRRVIRVHGDIGQGEPARILRERRPHQTPHGGLDDVGG